MLSLSVLFHVHIVTAPSKPKYSSYYIIKALPMAALNSTTIMMSNTIDSDLNSTGYTKEQNDSGFDNLPVWNILPYMVAGASCTMVAFIWQYVLYLRKSHSGKNYNHGLLATMGILLSMNLAFACVALGHYCSQARNVVFGDNLDELHWSIRATLGLTSTIVLISQFELLNLAKRAHAWEGSFIGEFWVTMIVLWALDLCAMFGVNIAKLTTIGEYFRCSFALGGFVFSFIIITWLIFRIFQLRSRKYCEEDIFGVSCIILKTLLEDAERGKPANAARDTQQVRAYRTVNFLATWLYAPMWFWCIATTIAVVCAQSFDKSFASLVVCVSLAEAVALTLPVILTKALCEFGDTEMIHEKQAEENGRSFNTDKEIQTVE
ncbi:unnamed protein product [Somion occarium]|uniref:Uncharacterized protein n=1 Tax=Somion occarium TaxID=3059160 RepID=A0ABP1D5R3_9APHY